MLEAMAAGRPILLSARGEAARLVERCGAGLVIPPEDAGALAGAFGALARDRERAATLGAAGRRCAVEEFGRDRVVDRWWDLLTSLDWRGSRAA
jgi:colanic acid biosynthesis glycosyl transferase WcaI